MIVCLLTDFLMKVMRKLIVSIIVHSVVHLIVHLAVFRVDFAGVNGLNEVIWVMTVF